MRFIGRARHSLRSIFHAFGVPLGTVFDRLPLPAFSGRGALCAGCGRSTVVRRRVDVVDYT